MIVLERFSILLAAGLPRQIHRGILSLNVVES